MALDAGCAGLVGRGASLTLGRPPAISDYFGSRREILRSVELFAGAGGLALGLHRAGFLPILAVDSDIRAFETLQANRNHLNQYTAGWGLRHGGVEHVDYTGLDSPDLLSAGAPCQP